MTILSALATLVALGLAVPCLVFFVECAVALLPGRTRTPVPVGPRPRTAVVVPAHDEQIGIAATIEGLRTQLGPDDRLLVVADNCTDATAAHARAAGAEVIERQDPTQRGKGFAIVFALDHLAAAPPERGGDRRRRLPDVPRRSGDPLPPGDGPRRPVQAEYVLAAPENPTPRGVLSALAVLVRNRVRPLGLLRLGLPSHLTGSGMAFPWDVLRAAPHPGANLVEDLVMGLELALAGHPPLICPSVARSPANCPIATTRPWASAAAGSTASSQPCCATGPPCLRAAWPKAPDLLALGLDLCVPPLALLVMMIGAATLAMAGLALLGGSPLPLFVLLAALAAVGCAVMGAWIKFGRDRLPLRFALLVPLYVLWKIPLYLSFIFKGKHKAWERTRRKGETAPPDGS